MSFCDFDVVDGDVAEIAVGFVGREANFIGAVITHRHSMLTPVHPLGAADGIELKVSTVLSMNNLKLNAYDYDSKIDLESAVLPC